MDLITISEYATAGSFFFATITYWLDYYSKKSKFKKLKKYLNFELRTIYNATRSDILQYENIRKSNYHISYRRKVYNNPLSKNILISGIFLDIFNKIEEQSSFTFIDMLIDQINKSDEISLQNSNKKSLDFFFNKRLVPLREALLELSEYNDFIDFSIMPKEFEGENKSAYFLDEYKDIQKKEYLTLEIIKKHQPERICRKLPDQFFNY